MGNNGVRRPRSRCGRTSRLWCWSLRRAPVCAAVGSIRLYHARAPRTRRKVLRSARGESGLLTRFITGLRVFGALVAGMSRMPWGRFALYNVLGGTAWATAAVSLGYFLWASIGLVEHWVGRISLLLAVALVLVVILRWSYRKAMRTKRDEDPKEGPPDPDKRAY